MRCATCLHNDTDHLPNGGAHPCIRCFFCKGFKAPFRNGMITRLYSSKWNEQHTDPRISYYLFLRRIYGMYAWEALAYMRQHER